MCSYLGTQPSVPIRARLFCSWYLCQFGKVTESFPCLESGMFHCIGYHTGLFALHRETDILVIVCVCACVCVCVCVCVYINIIICVWCVCVYINICGVCVLMCVCIHVSEHRHTNTYFITIKVYFFLFFHFRLKKMYNSLTVYVLLIHLFIDWFICFCVHAFRVGGVNAFWHGDQSIIFFFLGFTKSTCL